MVKETIYTYLGTNGIVSTPVFLEGIYSTQKIRLRADQGKVLTKDGTTFVGSVLIPVTEEHEVDEWYEINDPGQI